MYRTIINLESVVLTRRMALEVNIFNLELDPMMTGGIDSPLTAEVGRVAREAGIAGTQYRRNIPVLRNRHDSTASCKKSQETK